jgi:hypothetical protein
MEAPQQALVSPKLNYTKLQQPRPETDTLGRARPFVSISHCQDECHDCRKSVMTGEREPDFD